MISQFVLTYKELTKLLEVTKGDDYISYTLDKEKEIILVKDQYLLPVSIAFAEATSAVIPRIFLKEVLNYALPNEFVTIKFTDGFVLVRLSHDTVATINLREERQ